MRNSMFVTKLNTYDSLICDLSKKADQLRIVLCKFDLSSHSEDFRKSIQIVEALFHSRKVHG